MKRGRYLPHHFLREIEGGGGGGQVIQEGAYLKSQKERQIHVHNFEEGGPLLLHYLYQHSILQFVFLQSD